jgi:hypothetical protein
MSFAARSPYAKAEVSLPSQEQEHYLVLVVLEIELRALDLLGRYSTT